MSKEKIEASKETKITLSLGGKSVVITEDEANELYEALGKCLNKKCEVTDKWKKILDDMKDMEKRKGPEPFPTLPYIDPYIIPTNPYTPPQPWIPPTVTWCSTEGTVSMKKK